MRMELNGIQVDEPGFSHIGRDELASHLDSDEQEGEISRGSCSQPQLVVHHMSARRVNV